MGRGGSKGQIGAMWGSKTRKGGEKEERNRPCMEYENTEKMVKRKKERRIETKKQRRIERKKERKQASKYDRGSCVKGNDMGRKKVRKSAIKLSRPCSPVTSQKTLREHGIMEIALDQSGHNRRGTDLASLRGNTATKGPPQSTSSPAQSSNHVRQLS